MTTLERNTMSPLENAVWAAAAMSSFRSTDDLQAVITYADRAVEQLRAALAQRVHEERSTEAQ